MAKVYSGFGVSVFLMTSVVATGASAQSSASTTPTDTPPAAHSSMNPEGKSSYATGKPLEGQSKEGFWGHLNPLARKRWVKRQLDPIQDRTNELDQLQAKNANDIRDVDGRSQSGIGRAMNAASAADQHATDAANRADAANRLAGTASTRADALRGTVASLDEYQQISEAAVPFVAGRTTLGVKAKADLDGLAAKLSGERGYLVEVQGYSRSGVQVSQAMADSVVRYLVTAHQVPIYRIYRTGLGRQTEVVMSGEKPVVNGVRVTLLHNSLATMSEKASSASASSSGVSPQ